MRRELVVRLRVSRPAARALLAALLLGCPCGDLSPATREFKLTGYAPSGRRAYGMLRADGTADLASEGGNVLMLRGVKGETCGFSPVGKNLHVRNEEVQVFPGTEPGKVLIPNGRCYRDQGSGLGTRARRVEINGPELAAGAPDGKSPYATLYVRGNIRAERLIWGGKTIWDWPPETNWRLAGCPTPAPGETPAPCNRDKDAALALEDNMFDAVDPPLRIEWILSNSTGTAPNHYITRIGHNGYAGTPSSLAWSFPLRTDLPDWYWFQGKTSGVKSQDFDDCPNPAAPGGCDAQGTASARCRVEMLGTTDLKGTCIIKFKKVGQFQWSINPEACPVSSEGTPACAPWSCPAGTLCSQPAL